MPEPRWGLAVKWGREKGVVAFTDPFTGERIELETRHLASDNPMTDLRWMMRRAMDAKAEERAQAAVGRETERAEVLRLLNGVVPKRGLSR